MHQVKTGIVILTCPVFESNYKLHAISIKHQGKKQIHACQSILVTDKHAYYTKMEYEYCFAFIHIPDFPLGKKMTTIIRET